MCNPITTEHPELLLSKGVHEGYEWEVVRNHMAYRCGYVRIPPGHPWHGKFYDDVPADVHGGLTFAEADTACGKGGEDNAWWLGFDCAHAGDAPDPELPGCRLEREFPGDTIKDTAYAEAECRSLAGQAIAALAPEPPCAGDEQGVGEQGQEQAGEHDGT
jgi:hypothetical protein